MMKSNPVRLLVLIWAVLATAATAPAEDYSVTTFAGTAGVSGSAEGAPGSFRNPYGIAIDAARNLYVSDTLNNTIRKITPARVVSTLAGSAGTLGSADGTGSAARFNFPLGLAVDAAGNVFVADAKNSVIRRITSAGVVTTHAGAPAQFGSADGAAASARFFLPYGVAIDGDGNLYVADSGNHTVRKITAAGIVSTLAGAPMQSGFTDGTGAAARFNSPWGIAVDRSGTVFVTDNQNNAVRRISAAGVVTTLAGSASGTAGSQDGTGGAARFDQPRGLTVDASGNIFVMDYGSSILRRVTAAGVVSTLAGSARIIGDADSVGSAARFYDPTDVVADGSTLFIVDSSNNLVRRAVPASQASLPVIRLQPASQEASEGQRVTFRVLADGTGLSYRWLRNSAAIEGATSATFTLSAVQAGDVGVYTVRVTGAGGSLDSEGASLLVMPTDYGAIRLTERPQSANVLAGEAFSFVVTASGASLAYQWSKAGVDLPGATRATLSFAATQGSDSGTYSVKVSSGSASVTASAKLQVISSGPPSLTIVTQPAGASLTLGQPLRLSVVASASGELSYQWLRNDVPLAGATSSVYSVASAQSSDAGSYRVRVSAAGLTELSSAAVVTVSTPSTGPAARLANLSVRTSMASGQTLIVGVVVNGGSRDILVRAVGPALAVFGLGNAMADPRLELYNGGTRVLTNDNWSAALAPTFASVGAFALPEGSRDAAFLQPIERDRSIWALGTGPGVVLVEAYDTGGTAGARLVNMSARNLVGTGDDILIVGFNVAGTGSKQLLIRAVGPRLGGFGVSGFLADPKLEIYRGDAKVAENDNWSGSLAASFTSVGAFPLDPGSRDAALLADLSPGSYTVQVRGADGGTGEALVELYEVP